jgi:RecG-like helicase
VPQRRKFGARNNRAEAVDLLVTMFAALAKPIPISLVYWVFACLILSHLVLIPLDRIEIARKKRNRDGNSV